MSRVGKKSIEVPDKVNISYKNKLITVQGEKGLLSRQIHSALDLDIDDNKLNVIMSKINRINNSLQGLTRSLISNMIIGVSKGFERILEIHGIGYRAAVNGNCLVLNLGYSHPINFDLPTGISASVDKNNIIKLSGIDKELLGQTSAAIRRLRSPEPYKGKGIKYAQEHIQRKAGKTGTK